MTDIKTPKGTYEHGRLLTLVMCNSCGMALQVTQPVFLRTLTDASLAAEDLHARGVAEKRLICATPKISYVVSDIYADADISKSNLVAVK